MEILRLQIFDTGAKFLEINLFLHENNLAYDSIRKLLHCKSAHKNKAYNSVKVHHIRILEHNIIP